MDLGLKGKCAIIVGGSKGLGKATALQLAEEGVHVAVCARGEAALRATEAELRQKGVKAFAQACDVGKPAELNAFLEAARAALGGVDILFNNASAFSFPDDDAGWAASINVDLLAAVRASRTVIPWMTERGGGAIVHMSSIAGREAGFPPSYAAVKAALISHAKTLAVSLAPKRIRVNVVAPGAIEWDGGLWAKAKRENRPFYDMAVGRIPSGRMGTVEEIANVVTFLVSPRASWIAGACIPVDGGEYKGNL